MVKLHWRTGSQILLLHFAIMLIQQCFAMLGKMMHHHLWWLPQWGCTELLGIKLSFLLQASFFFLTSPDCAIIIILLILPSASFFFQFCFGISHILNILVWDDDILCTAGFSFVWNHNGTILTYHEDRINTKITWVLFISLNSNYLPFLQNPLFSVIAIACYTLANMGKKGGKKRSTDIHKDKPIHCFK